MIVYLVWEERRVSGCGVGGGEWVRTLLSVVANSASLGCQCWLDPPVRSSAMAGNKAIPHFPYLTIVILLPITWTMIFPISRFHRLPGRTLKNQKYQRKREWEKRLLHNAPPQAPTDAEILECFWSTSQSSTSAASKKSSTLNRLSRSHPVPSQTFFKKQKQKQSHPSIWKPPRLVLKKQEKTAHRTSHSPSRRPL